MTDQTHNKGVGGLHCAVYYGDRLEKTITLAQDCIFIGRLLTAHLPVDDPKVSRMHAVIEIREGRDVIVNDLESSNGTRVNGKTISVHTLKHGETIEVGDSRIKVEFLSPEQVAAFPSVVYHSGISRGLGQQVGVDTVMLDTHVPQGKVEVSNEEIDQVLSQLEPAVQRHPTTKKAAGKKDLKSHDDAKSTAKTAVTRIALDTKVKGEKVDPAVPVRSAGVNTTQVSTRAEKERAALRMIHGTGTALEVKVQWGDELLDVMHLDSPVTISIGQDRRNTYIMPPMESYPKSVPMISPIPAKEGGGYTLGFTEKMEGWIYTGEKLQSLVQLQKSPRLRVSKSGKQKIFYYPISASDKGMVAIENIAFCFQTVRAFPHYKSPPSKRDRRPFFIGLAVFMAMVLSSMLVKIPEVEPTVAEEVKKTTAAYEVIYSRERAKRIFQNLANKDVREIGSPSGKVEGKALVGETTPKANLRDSKAGGEEGARGRGTPRVNVPTQTTPSGSATLANALNALKSDDISRLLGATGFTGGGGGVGTSNRPSNVGGAPRVFANLGSSLKGEPGGQGSGGVGGGESVDIGGLGTKGKGSGAGGYGTVKLGEKIEAFIEAGEGEGVNIMGALDRDLIRKVVERNKGQIQFCYDTKLQLSRGRGKPNGRVMVFWRIAPSGRVVETSIISSSMQDASFEQCLMDRIRTWIFPEPKGGGVVKVEYPFSFRPAG